MKMITRLINIAKFSIVTILTLVLWMLLMLVMPVLVIHALLIMGRMKQPEKDVLLNTQ